MSSSKEVRRSFGLSTLAGMSLASAMFLSSGVSAQDLSTCQCVVARGTTALIRDAQGTVMATQRGGPAAIQGSGSMRVPGRVITGASSSSSAVIALGNGCEIEVGPNRTAEITPEGGRLCLRVAENAPAGGQAPATEGGTSGLLNGMTLPAVVSTLGVAGIAGIAISTNGGSGRNHAIPVSP